jgi:hypothetical protein
MISALVIFILALVVTGLGRERGGVKFADGL